jgi:hypothetical protein
MTDTTITDQSPQILTPVVERIPEQRTRADKWLRALSIIALSEAIILMTAALILGFLAVIAGVSLFNSVNEAIQTPTTDTTIPDTVPSDSGIDPNAGDYTDAELQDYTANPGQFCVGNPGHPLCP